MVLEMPTKTKRRKALQTLPPSLYETFDAVITRIKELPSEKAKLGIQVLMWLHLAYRPFQLVELQHALSVEPGQTEFDPDNIPSQKMLLDSCLGLVIHDEETGTIRFVHYTLEEYFRTSGDKNFPDGCSTAALPVKFLIDSDFEKDPAQTYSSATYSLSGCHRNASLDCSLEFWGIQACDEGG